MMRVITSQSYLNDEIVDEKMAQMEAGQITGITLPVWTTGMTDDDGNELCILSDGHHRYAAAFYLDIPVSFDESEHPEHLTGERLLEAAYNDSDYRYLDDDTLVW